MRLDPAPLRDIAEHLDNMTWLDVKVVALGNFERVRIRSLVIRRDDDLVELEQHWLANDELREALHLVSSEDVMWCRPTVFELADVTPWKEPAPPERTIQQADSWEWWCSQKAVSQSQAVDEQTVVEWMKNANSDQSMMARVHFRHLVILVMYEISTESALAICQRAGYVSIQPMLTARMKFRAEHGLAGGHARFTSAMLAARRLHGATGIPVPDLRAGGLLAP